MTGPLQFSFLLGGIDAMRLGILEDVLRPVFYGLRRAGHHVVSYGQGLAPAPAINVVVEHEGADLARRIADARAAAAGVPARIGLFCADDVDGVASEPRRAAVLRDATRSADFVWTIGASPALDDVVTAARCAIVTYGFDPLLVARRLVPDAARRDAGLVVYGLKTPYRMALVDRLKAAGMSPFVVEPGHFPDYVAGDLLSRAAVVVVCRDTDTQRAPSAARIARALCGGTLVVAEAPVAGPCPLASHVTACALDDIPARCAELLGKGDVAHLGLAALEAFRSGTSMAHGLGDACRLAAGAPHDS